MSKFKIKSFLKLLDIQLEVQEKSQASKLIAKGSIDLQSYHGQAYNTTHGGVLFSLADTVAGYLVWKNIPKTFINSTIEMKINYISRIPVSGTLKAVAELIHLGKRTAVVKIDLIHGIDSEKKRVAIALGTFQILNIDKIK